MTLPFDRLAIIAGEGRIPLDVAERAQERGAEVHILAVKGHADLSLYSDKYPTHVIRMGALKSNLALLRKSEISDIIMVGAVRRPSILELAPDAAALKVLSKGILKQGDDGLLRAVITHLEESEGIRVHGLDSVMDDLSPPEGVLGSIRPNQGAMEDVERGKSVLLALADEDVGQAVVVQETLVLGIEGIEGTDGLVERSAILKRAGTGPVLIKLKKPSQTTRADLPTIGPNTIRVASEAGFSGIAVEAEGSIMVDRETCVAEADAAGLFVIGIKGGDAK